MMWKIALPFLAAVLAVGLGQDRPGGATNIDDNNPNFKVAVNFAIIEYNRHSEHHHFYALVKVLSARSQVVAGVNYIMTLKLGKTECSKYSDGDNCPIITDPAKFIYCDFTVWSRPWLNDMRLSGSACRD